MENDRIRNKLLSVQKISQMKLAKIFNANANLKYLVLEASLIRPLERVCGVQWLKSCGVEKIFKLEESTPDFNTKPVFYMIFGNFTVFRKVVDQIRSKIDPGNVPKNNYHIILVPRNLHAFKEELEELGLLHAVIQLYSFQWLPIQLDFGILSMEIPYVYNKLFLQQDMSFLPNLSKALWELFFVIGKPRFTVALGQYSNSILRQLDMLNKDKGESDKLEADIGAVIIIDRNIDYPSALLTPGIYSALLNEVYGVKSGICELKEQEHSLESDEKCNPVIKKQPVNFNLDSCQDSVYADIKNRYFTEVTSVLCNLTKQLKSETINSKDMALDEIKKYVQNQLQATKSRKKFISNHLLAAETIVSSLGPRYENQLEIESNMMRNTNKSDNFNYVEQIISTENDKHVCLRLFCLMCITQKLSDSEVRSFWTKFLHQFGYKYGFAYRNLINAEIIQEFTSGGLQSKIKLPKFSTNNFYNNVTRLKQIPTHPDKINLKFPICASYVFGGSYIPLITQIASMLLNSTPINEIKTKLEPLGLLTIRNDRGFPLQPRSVLIYLIGGITYAEIAACNLLESLTATRIIVLSDCIITGNDLMKDILDLPK